MLDGVIDAVADAINAHAKQHAPAHGIDEWERLDAEEWRPPGMKKRGALEIPLLDHNEYTARMRSKRVGVQYYAL